MTTRRQRGRLGILLGFWLLPFVLLLPLPSAVAQIGPPKSDVTSPPSRDKIPVPKVDVTIRDVGRTSKQAITARLFVGDGAEAKKGPETEHLDNNQAGKHHRLQAAVGFNAKLTADTVVNSLGMRLVSIAPGSFAMGSPIWSEIADLDESAHQVRLTLPFYLGVFEVTQGQFQDVMQANPSRFQNVDRPHNTHEFPVDRVTWMEAMEFCRRLSALPSERRAGRVYRLPTEAEWEFACRAGNESAYHFGEDVEELKSHGWFAGNTERSTQPVGRKLPNSLGLYDMYGNVWEWCSDWYAPYDTPELVTEDPRGAEQGEYRVLRGGSWLSPPENCRSADRGSEAPRRRCDRIGFRVLMMVGPIPEASASRLLTERAGEFMPLATASQLFGRAAANEALR